MIAANVAAAESLEEKRQPCMYRVHDAPDPAKIEALREFVGSLGLSLARGQVLKPATFARLLEQGATTPYAAMLNDLVLRSQSQASLQPGEYRAFRSGAAPLLPFHLADPPLFRPVGASRADRRVQVRHGRAAARRRGGVPADRREDLRDRTTRRDRRARCHGPLHRRLPERAHQRHLRRTDLRRDPLRACSSPSTTAAAAA